MQPDTDPNDQLTEAVHPNRPMRSSRIPPSEMGPYEDASSDVAGRAKHRRASLTRKILVLGGAGIMAAAATSAAVLAARHLRNAMDGRDGNSGVPRERGLAPRFADMDEDEREAIRRRARDRARRDQNRDARLRAMAARERAAPRRNVAREMADTASGLSGSLNGVVSSLTSAMIGFRQVAAQAGGIMREFSDAADAVRSFLDKPADQGDAANSPKQERSTGQRESDNPVHDRTHRL